MSANTEKQDASGAPGEDGGKRLPADHALVGSRITRIPGQRGRQVGLNFRTNHVQSLHGPQKLQGPRGAASTGRGTACTAASARLGAGGRSGTRVREFSHGARVGEAAEGN